VAALNQEDGGDLHLPGSAKLVQTLLEHALIDEFRLMIDPVVVGGGKRLFPDDGALRQLQLADCKVTTKGAILATYTPASDVNPCTLARCTSATRPMPRSTGTIVLLPVGEHLTGMVIPGGTVAPPTTGARGPTTAPSSTVTPQPTRASAPMTAPWITHGWPMAAPSPSVTESAPRRPGRAGPAARRRIPEVAADQRGTAFPARADRATAGDTAILDTADKGSPESLRLIVRMPKHQVAFDYTASL